MTRDYNTLPKSTNNPSKSMTLRVLSMQSGNPSDDTSYVVKPSTLQKHRIAIVFSSF